MVANRHLRQLIAFCASEKAKLVLVSSMGQKAVEDSEPIYSQVLITDPVALLSYFGINKNAWESKMAMAPRVVIKPKVSEVREKLAGLRNLLVDGKPIEANFLEGGDVSLKLELYNTVSPTVHDISSGQDLDFKKMGLSVMSLQDQSGSYAYHDSQGVMAVYDPNNPTDTDVLWADASVLDIAPSLLRAFDADVPNYMEGRAGLLC